MKNFGSPQLGLRVKYARDLLKMTQEQLSEKLGFKDRQTVSSIETGNRSMKADELLVLAEALDKDVQFFLDPFSVVAEAQYCWRASPGLHGEVLDRFEERAGGWIGLLRWMREKHKVESKALKPVLRLTVASSFERAQVLAEQLVKDYELGPVPAESLVQFIDETLDIPVLFVDTDEDKSETISGAACDIGELGVILINRKESVARRSFDLAHELFHSLTWTAMKPAHRESNTVEERKSANAHRIEQLANSFAAALLMPTSSLEAFIDHTKPSDSNQLAEVAVKLRVSTDALGWRLFHMGRIDSQTRTSLAAVRVLSDRTLAPRMFSRKFVMMLHTALDRGWLSARKAAKSLGMSLDELTDVFVMHEMQPPFQL